jgi:hypothetical protein
MGDSNNNNWDNGNGEGNYWSDYTGLDDGSNGRTYGDGIGDTLTPHFGLDHYPFVNRSGWNFPAIPRLFDPDDYSSDGNYILHWTNNRGCTKYVIQEDTSFNFNTPTVVYEGAALSCIIAERTNDTYYYRLKGCNELNDGAWYTEGNALNLSWNLNMIDCTHYQVYYLTEKMSAWELLGTISHPKTTLNHSLLENGLEYSYKIKALDARGQSSGFSKIVTDIPQDSVPPKPPVGLRVDKISYNEVELVWDENFEDDVKGYKIYRGNLSNKTSWGDLIGTVYSYDDLRFVDSDVVELTEYFYRIKAFDEVPNDSGPHGPEINISIGDIEIAEDGYDDSSIDLFKWFKDINGDTLKFSCEGQKNIKVKIYENNGTVVLVPDENWYGNETLTFYASDLREEVSDTIIVRVISVNDPPGMPEILAPTDGTTLEYGKTINFIGRCDDIDLPNDLLTFTWTSNLQGFLGTGEELRNIALSVGVHQITLEVADKAGSSLNTTIEVIIEQVEVVSSGEDDINWAVIVGSISVVIIIILIIFILLIFLKKRKKVEMEQDQDLKTDLTPDAKMISELPTQMKMNIPTDRSDQTQLSSVTTEQDIMPDAMPSSEIPTGQLATAQNIDAEIDMVLDSETQIMQKYSALPEQPSPGGDYDHELPETKTVPQLPEHTPGLGEVEPISEPLAAQDGLSQPTITEVVQNIENGKAYIIKTKSIDFGLDIFDNLIASTPERGLIITRTYPSKLPPNQARDGVTKIWLSKSAEPDSVAPENITKLSHVISEFQNANDNAVLLLDGLDYLISNNDFPRILKFIEYLHEKVILNSGILLIPLNPHILSSEYLELLENELVNIINDPFYYKLNSIK